MRRFTLLMTALLLCAGGMFLRAETISHGFNTMNKDKTIVFNMDFTEGTTDLVTYTCHNCEFGPTASSSQVSIRLVDKNDYVVISPALNNLKSLYMVCETSVEPKSILRVYVSEDGSTWNDALTGAETPMAGAMRIAIPEGYYYLKIANSKSTAIYIRSIAYEFDNCPSCFTYDF